MPRISKRKNVIDYTRATAIKERISKGNTMSQLMSNGTAVPQLKRYHVAVYARLSVDGDEKKNESIDTQIDIIMKYISESKEDMQIYDIYKDIGKTGTNFERAEFNRMLQDIRLLDVNCVIVKDLSRFARNYIEAGNYIERIFPFLGIRFIAVADQFDTEDIYINEKTMGMNIKNLVNEMYAKEFSKKTQIQIKQRIGQGIYVGSVNPYGYYTLKGDKKRVLYPEKGTSDVIKAIFKDFSENHNMNGVVRMLAGMRANPALVYRKTKQIFCPNEIPYKAWATESVKRVLKNPIYLGMLVQGRSSCLGRDEKNRKWFDKSEWVTWENTHEPLVDKKVFDEIQVYFKGQEMLRLEKEKSDRKSVLKENVFYDLIICGCCKRPMQRVHHNESFLNKVHRNEVNVYSCEYAYSSGDDKCVSNRINESKVTELLFQVLKKEFLIYLNNKKDFITYNLELRNERKNKYEKVLPSLNRKIRKLEEEIDNAYRAYRESIINSDKFCEIQAGKREQISRLNVEIQEIEKKLKQLGRKVEMQNKSIRSLLDLKDSNILSKEIVNTLIDKITVYPGKKVEVKFTYTNELRKEISK